MFVCAMSSRLVPIILQEVASLRRAILVLLCSVLMMSFGAAAHAAVIVERGPANIRAGPSTQHAVLTSVPVGQQLEEIDRVGDWFRIILPDGREGYIYAPLVRHEASVPANTIAIPRSTLNIRSGPGTDHSIIGKAQPGAAFSVIGKSGDWVRISFDGKHGWMAGWLCNVTTLEPSHFETGELTKKVVVLRDGLRVRSGASEHFGVIATLRSGAQADYLASTDGWHRIRTSAGVTGWVDATDVRTFNVDSRHGVNYVIGDDYWEMRVAPSGVTNANVNLRAEPNTSSRVLTTIHRGHAFSVLGQRGDWYNVQYGSLTGWVAGWLVSIRPTAGPSHIRLERSPSVKTLTVRGDFHAPSVVSFGPLSMGIVAAPAEGTKGRLEVYAGEIGSMDLGAAGLLINFTEQPSYRVVYSRPGEIRLEFYSTVEAVSYNPNHPNSITVDMLGCPVPKATFDEAAGRLVVRLEGASMSTPVVLPANQAILGVTAQDAGGSSVIQVMVEPGSQYNLRRSPNTLTIDVLPRGLSGKIIAIDPGHGGKDPGAVGPSGLPEKTVGLDIAFRLKTLLEQHGATVVMTRHDDSTVELATRVEIARDSRADLFVSIHNNASTDRSVHGTSTFYAETSLNTDRSKKLAEIVQRTLVNSLGRHDAGVRRAELYVTRNAPVAAVVAEIVYISNHVEENLLRDSEFLARAAFGLFNAIREYFGE